MQDVWREYTPLFCRALTADFNVFTPCSAFCSSDPAFRPWQRTLRSLQLDHRSREILLDRLFRHVELRCGRPSDRQAIEDFRASPYLRHTVRTETVHIFVGYVYDPWIVGSIAYDYPLAKEVQIIIEAPLERRDRDDLTLFVRQMCHMGRRVTITPAWERWHNHHRSDILTSLRPVFTPPWHDTAFGLL